MQWPSVGRTWAATSTTASRGERYLSTTDKASRRMQLRKLVDEGGQDTVGGPQVSHPMLSRWESRAYGVTPEEVDALEKGDCDTRRAGKARLVGSP